MRLKRWTVIALGIVATSGVALAYNDPFKQPDPAEYGPIVKKIVIRHDAGRPPTPVLPPGFKQIDPTQDVQTSVASVTGVGRATSGGSITIASATPQQSLEMRLKSLAKDLR